MRHHQISQLQASHAFNTYCGSPPHSHTLESGWVSVSPECCQRRPRSLGGSEPRPHSVGPDCTLNQPCLLRDFGPRQPGWGLALAPDVSFQLQSRALWRTDSWHCLFQVPWGREPHPSPLAVTCLFSLPEPPWVCTVIAPLWMAKHRCGVVLLASFTFFFF